VKRRLLIAAGCLAALALNPAAAGAKVVWLCKPGQHPDPCTPGLSTTVFSPALQPLRVVHPKPVRKPRVDCFYVYPTVSDQSTIYSNRRVDPEERSIALYEAARYSQVCRVYAPMYRQETLTALDSGVPETPARLSLPLRDITNAFETYLHRYNHGRGFVLIGHSQGAFLLETLIARDVDPRPGVRERMLSAILLGGNVLVRRGENARGTFRHVPACRSAIELGCVIAYSTFDQPPPVDSLFGRTTVTGDQVLCTNPAALLGASTIDPILPSQPFAPGTLIAAGIALLGVTQPMPPTVWSALPAAYSARCAAIDGANVLEVTALDGAQVPKPSPTPEWGLHLLDASIELGDLVAIVRREGQAFAQRTLVP